MAQTPMRLKFAAIFLINLVFLAFWGAYSGASFSVASFEAGKLTDWIQAISALISAVCAFVIIFATGQQARFARKAVEIATAANAMNRDLSITENRAWLDFDVVLTGPIKITSGNIYVPLSIQIKNIGKSVALNVTERVVVTPTDSSILSPDHPLIVILRSESTGSPLATAILPQRDCIKKYTQSFAISEARLKVTEMAANLAASGLVPSEAIPNMPLGRLSLIVCVDYQIAAGGEHHQTGRTYDLVPPLPVWAFNENETFSTQMGFAEQRIVPGEWVD